MSRFCGDDDPKPILDAAAHWRDNALLKNGSVFTNGRIWTQKALNELDEFFVKRPDLGEGRFLEKLQVQLAACSAEARQLAAEMMWLMYLCPSSLTPDHKRKTIQTIWEWSGEPCPTASRWLDNDVLAGVGSAGPGFNQNQWRELVFVIQFARNVWALDTAERDALFVDGWQFDEWLRNIPDWEARQFRHMLLFMLYPDDFERVFGQTDRKAIVRHYTKREHREVNRLDAVQLDRELLSIRKRLEVERGTTQLDYYVPPLKGEWRSETFAAATDSVTDAHVRAALKEIDDGGVPVGAESTGYDLLFDGKSYPPKLVLSLAVKYATGEPLDRATFSGGDSSSAFRVLRRLGFEIVAKNAADELPDLIERFLKQANEGEELGTQGYLTEYRGLRVRVSFGKGNFARIPWIAFLADGQSVPEGIYPVLLYFKERQLLLLCYGVSETHPPKLMWTVPQGTQTVLEFFMSRYGSPPERYRESLVSAMYDLQQPLVLTELQQALEDVIDSYEQVLESQEVIVLPQVEATEEDEPVVLSIRTDLKAAVTAFSEALHASGVHFGRQHEDLVSSFIASLVTKPLVILTGLSGSGKTQIAIRFGEWLGPDRLHTAAVRPDWTGAEALFGYEDALKREVDGRRAWTVPAPLEFILNAAKDPQHPYVLLLDEMNLAHVERYFADVLSGMESGQPCLPNLYKDSDKCWRLKADGDRIPFPKNLWIVGTVNIDETTYMFSPKVLDRANTFEFRVSPSDLSVDAVKPIPCAHGDQDLVRGLLSIARNDSWHRDRPNQSSADLATRLRQLHETLGRFNLEFGHRVFYESMRFGALAEEAGLSGLNAVLDKIVMQKILPRLHGSRRRLEAPLLALAHFCRDLPDEVESNDKLPLLNIEKPPEQGAALPTAYGKAIRMLLNLRANQFASFTE